jgi:TIR domain
MDLDRKMPHPTRRLRIFLCHSSENKSAVKELHRRLTTDGFEPWLDDVNLLPGHDWDFEIRNAVQTSDVVVVCLSRSSVDKVGYVQKEIKLALDAADQRPEGDIFLIPLRLEECLVPHRLSRWQWADFFVQDGYQRLVTALTVCAARIRISVSPERSMEAVRPSEKATREKYPDRRRWERVSLVGERACALLGKDSALTVPVIDLSYGGLALQLTEEPEEPLLAVLQVPLLPSVRVNLRRIYRLQGQEHGGRSGYAFII